MDVAIASWRRRNGARSNLNENAKVVLWSAKLAIDLAGNGDASFVRADSHFGEALLFEFIANPT